MTSRAGVLRSADGLRAGLDALTALADTPAGAVDQDAWEVTNLLTVSTLLAEAALLREETRGSHWREDFPERDDADQAGHHDWWLDGDEPRHAFRPAAPTDVEVEVTA
jgi:L-aspartate oxidase